MMPHNESLGAQLLEAAAHDGVPFVREQMLQLRDSGDLDEAQSAKLERIVRSIERGFIQASSHVTAFPEVADEARTAAARRCRLDLKRNIP